LSIERVKPRQIIHLDMDAFYAAVEVLDNPKLKGQPVIVGGTSKRGVVSAASYEARKYGVHSAQPMAAARRRCPHGVFLPVRMGRYREISDQVFGIFRRFTPLVEPISLDEAFLDVTGLTRLFGPPEAVARRIKGLIEEEVGLTASAGVASTKLAAKIASDLEKPDGLVVVAPDRDQEFLDPLPIGRLWGVGRATREALTLLGVETIGDLGRLPVESLVRKFGDHGRKLHRLARGLDEREVTPWREVKSIGAEETFLEDILQVEEAKREVLRLAVRSARRLRRHGFLGRTVTLKVKYHDFKQITRSETLARPTDHAGEVFQTACRLLEKTAAGVRPVRLLGLSLSHLTIQETEGPALLFEEGVGRRKNRNLDQALDAITDKYGEEAIMPASLLPKPGGRP